MVRRLAQPHRKKMCRVVILKVPSVWVNCTKFAGEMAVTTYVRRSRSQSQLMKTTSHMCMFISCNRLAKTTCISGQQRLLIPGNLCPCSLKIQFTWNLWLQSERKANNSILWWRSSSLQCTIVSSSFQYYPAQTLGLTILEHYRFYIHTIEYLVFHTDRLNILSQKDTHLCHK